MGDNQSTTVNATMAAPERSNRETLRPELQRLLRETAGGTREVPRGWARVERDAGRMLQAAIRDEVDRASIRIVGVYVLASQPHVRLSAPDRVVHGILRKAIAQARHTCDVCGRKGMVWEHLSQFRVLCPRCAAPHTVAADLDALENAREQHRRSKSVPVSDIPPRLAAAIRAAVAPHAAEGAVNEPSNRFLASSSSISHEEFERWCAWLLALRDIPAFEAAIASVS